MYRAFCIKFSQNIQLHYSSFHKHILHSSSRLNTVYSCLNGTM